MNRVKMSTKRYKQVPNKIRELKNTRVELKTQEMVFNSRIDEVEERDL